MAENLITNKNNKSSILALSVFFFGLLGVAFTSFNILKENSVQVVFTQNASSIFKSENPQIYITTEILKNEKGEKNKWQEANDVWGASYEFFVHNNSHYDFQNYEIELFIPEYSRFNGMPWTGKFEVQNKKVILKPFDFNAVIKFQSSVKFGFVLYTPRGMTPEEFINDNLGFNISGYFNRKVTDSIFFSFFLTIMCCGILGSLAFLISRKSQSDQKKSVDERIENYIRLCANFIDVRDEYTKKHSTHVAEYSRLIASRLGKTDDEQKNIYYVGMLHDVGKVMISPDILRKPGRLEGEEWEEMKKHTTYGAGILQDFNDIPNIRDAVLYHHERYDGTGYMFGLQGKNIPEIARIICVADSYDAMATDRAYRKHLSDEVILDELEKNRGTQFDPDIVDVAIDLIKEGKFKIVD